MSRFKMNVNPAPEFSIQIFVYVKELDITNNCPFLGFKDNKHAHYFFDNLKGTVEPDKENGWFVINNVHQLSEACRIKLKGMEEFNLLDNIILLNEVYIADNNEIKPDEIPINFSDVIHILYNKNIIENEKAIIENNIVENEKPSIDKNKFYSCAIQ